jgi:predicted transposase YbfD/YdcC
LKFKDTTISTHETLDADHGRIETRNYTVIHDVGWLQARHQWPGLEAVVVVESQREINGKITNETRFYITSLVLLANAVGPMIRAHWAIENSLHWVMDMVFRDDECRVRTGRWVTRQRAGGDIEYLTGGLDRMRPMCHRAPALSIPAGDRAVMNPAARLAQCPGHAPGVASASPSKYVLVTS